MSHDLYKPAAETTPRFRRPVGSIAVLALAAGLSGCGAAHEDSGATENLQQQSPLGALILTIRRQAVCLIPRATMTGGTLSIRIQSGSLRVSLQKRQIQIVALQPLFHS